MGAPVRIWPNRATRLVCLVTVGLMVVAVATQASAQTGTGGGTTANTPGVTANTITIGLVTSETGAAAPYFFDAKDGAQARFDVENAKGGVGGKKLKLIAIDNQTSPTQESAGWQSLNQQGMFAAIGYNALLFLSYRYLQEQGIPVVGDGLDGPE